MTDLTPKPSRRSCLKGLALLGALPALPAPALTAAPGSADLTAALEPVRARFGLPAIAAAVARSGVTVAVGATGVRVHGTDIRVTLGDRFHLGSDTKAMTATLVGMAVDEGKLRWGATIGEVLGAEIPGLDARLAAVTLEQLLSHSSGIPSDGEDMVGIYFNTDAFEYNLTPLRLRAIRAFKAHTLVSPPGKEFHYSNMGYIIVGAMLEKVTGIPWEELITRRLFEPLRLTTAGLGPQATRGRIDAPVGHRVSGKSITPMLWGPAADNPPVLGPAGVAHMSVVDFATWAGWNAGQGRRAPALVKPETLAHIHSPRIDTGRIPNPRPGEPSEGRYACGWGVVQFSWARKPVLVHNGSNNMNLAKIVVDTNNDLGVVAVTNFPDDPAEDALNAVTQSLYRQFAPG